MAASGVQPEAGRPAHHDLGDADQGAAPGPVAATSTATDFVDCYREHYARVVRALRLAGADPASAEEAAQEAFARALVHWRRVCRGSNPPGYVYLSAFRQWRRSARRDGAHREAGPRRQVRASTDGDVSSALDLEAALARMPLRRRQCAVLCLVLGFAPAEAGRQLGIAAGTVRKHLDEARRDLRHGWAAGG